MGKLTGAAEARHRQTGKRRGSRGGRSMRADDDECGGGKRGMGRGQAERREAARQARDVRH